MLSYWGYRSDTVQANTCEKCFCSKSTVVFTKSSQTCVCMRAKDRGCVVCLRSKTVIGCHQECFSTEHLSCNNTLNIVPEGQNLCFLSLSHYICVSNKSVHCREKAEMLKILKGGSTSPPSLPWMCGRGSGKCFSLVWSVLQKQSVIFFVSGHPEHLWRHRCSVCLFLFW